MNNQIDLSKFNLDLSAAVKSIDSLFEKDGFVFRKIKDELLLVIQENRVLETKQYMINNQINGLEINMSLGYTKLDINFLKEFPFIKNLNIVHQPLGNIDAINSLRNLRSLSLDAYFYTEINFNNFPQLEECFLHWTPNAKNLFTCNMLKSLSLRHFKKNDLSEIKNLKLLEKLQIYSSPVDSLKGVNELKVLKELTLGRLTKLINIDDIQELPYLEKLIIQSCKKIPSHNLWMLKSLKSLILSDIGNIKTIRQINNLENLEELYITGDSKILDGDTSMILQIPKLKKVGLAHYSHYRPTSLEIEAKIEGKELNELLRKYSFIKVYKKMLKH